MCWPRWCQFCSKLNDISDDITPSALSWEHFYIDDAYDNVILINTDIFIILLLPDTTSF